MTRAAEDLAREALEEIGEYSPVDQTIDPEFMRRTLQRLHSAIALLGETRFLIFDIKSEVSIPLLADTAAYTFQNATDAPETGTLFIHKARLRDDASADEDPIRIVSIEEFEDEADPGDRSGWPTMAAVRQIDDNIQFWPVPASSDTKTIILTVQQMGPDLAGQANAKTQSFLSEAWSRWAVLQTAYDISGGVVRSLDRARRDKLQADAELWLNRLLGYSNRAHGIEPITSYQVFY